MSWAGARLELGVLAILLSLAAFDVLNWAGVLLGWGAAQVAIGLLELRDEGRTA